MRDLECLCPVFRELLASEESLCSQLHQAAYPSVVKAVGTFLCLLVVYGGSHLVHIPSMLKTRDDSQ